MDNDLKRLRESLAKAVGFTKQIIYKGGFDGEKTNPPLYGWAIGKWKEGDFHSKDAPDFTSSMDACVKWIAPALNKEVGIDWIKYDYQDQNAFVVCHIKSGLLIESGMGDSESIAFCRAADKIFVKTERSER